MYNLALFLDHGRRSLEKLAVQLGNWLERERRNQGDHEQVGLQDPIFVDLVHQVWSRKQNEADQLKKDLFKSDLGNDVDQDVMEYIEEEENQSLIR